MLFITITLGIPLHTPHPRLGTPFVRHMQSALGECLQGSMLSNSVVKVTTGHGR